MWLQSLSWVVHDTSSPRLAGMWPTTKGKVFGAFGKRATPRKRALASQGETVVLVSPQALDGPLFEDFDHNQLLSFRKT